MPMVPGRRGQVQTLTGSPLPQGEPGRGAPPVRLTQAFTQFLPPRSYTFFQRAYFARYPRPAQAGTQPPWPFPVQLARIEVPAQQALVVQQTNFQVYEHTGIGPDDVVEVDPGRVITVFGFSTEIGNRGMTDFSTNVQARGDVVQFNNNTPAGFPPTPGQGKIYPFAGNAQDGLNGFAYYGQPGDLVACTAWILRRPPYDTRLFSVRITGYLVGWNVLQGILDKLAG